MIRQRLDIPPNRLVEGLLNLSRHFDVAVVLNSNRGELPKADKYARYDVLAAFGVKEQMIPEAGNFNALHNFQKRQGWKFGFLPYDLKNELEDLASENHDGIKAPSIHFFIPRLVLYLKDDECILEYDEEDSVHALALIQNLNSPITDFSEPGLPSLNERVPRDKYIQNAEAIRQHIQLGNIYEMNYCVEFFSGDAMINPQLAYLRLNDISPMPFSAFYKMNGRYIICASPERFLAKRNNKIISQPIKGTIRRGENATEDEQLKKKLYDDPKERSENVMIVDLVRNDLSRTASKGSVVVEELFGIYTFRNLHQMISTVVSEMKPGVDAVEVIRSAFPMGSMTGAPKVSAMRLIENFEDTARGIYSGAIGYFDPDGDFDFNVVIRSIVYNEDEKYLSCMAGSAITINSIPENEYAECRLKAETMLSVLRPGYGKSTEADNARKTDGIHITK